MSYLQFLVVGILIIIIIASYFLSGRNLCLTLVYIPENGLACNVLHVYTIGIRTWLCLWWLCKFSSGFRTILTYADSYSVNNPFYVCFALSLFLNCPLWSYMEQVGTRFGWRSAFWVESVLMLPFVIFGYVVKPLHLKGKHLPCIDFFRSFDCCLFLNYLWIQVLLLLNPIWLWHLRQLYQKFKVLYAML